MSKIDHWERPNCHAYPYEHQTETLHAREHHPKKHLAMCAASEKPDEKQSLQNKGFMVLTPLHFFITRHCFQRRKASKLELEKSSYRAKL